MYGLQIIGEWTRITLTFRAVLRVKFLAVHRQLKTPPEMDVALAPWITHKIVNIYSLDFNKFN